MINIFMYAKSILAYFLSKEAWVIHIKHSENVIYEQQKKSRMMWVDIKMLKKKKQQSKLITLLVTHPDEDTEATIDIWFINDGDIVIIPTGTWRNE